MKYRDKIKAFTILEALISLLIMAIIIGLTYTIISFFSKQFIYHNNYNNIILDYQLFESTFKRDLYLTDKIEADGKILFLKNYDESVIEYKFLNTGISRRMNNTTSHFDLDYYGFSVSEAHQGSFLSDNVTIKMSVKVPGDTIHQLFYKYIDQSETINKKFVNEN